MKKQRKNLSLHRETLSRLSSEDLREIRGREETDSAPSCIDGCPTVFTCKETLRDTM